MWDLFRRTIIGRLSAIETKQDQIMSTLDDFKTILGEIAADVTAVKSDVDGLLAKIAAIPPAGLTPEQQAAIDAAVTQGQSIKASLDAIHAEVNPAPAPAPSP
jgi:hypothetical protein